MADSPQNMPGLLEPEGSGHRMKTVAVTQRVCAVPEYGERRDCLDQAWTKFLDACGLLPVLLPNVREAALTLCATFNIAGLVLTGGNDLVELGGDAPERDAVENALVDWAEENKVAVVGICRGMQLIQQRLEIPLRRVAGHVVQRQIIRIDGRPREVNSYHQFGAFESRAPLEVSAVAEDGVVESIRHSALPIAGMMWHPERFSPFSPADLDFFRGFFRVD
jgi:N5-(cytidine 5'-diphosphoramidyl)-L-glutamine hydrolase